jgi:hypothetical protein
MKKIKLLSLALAIFFVAFSAFTKPKADTTLYGKDSNGGVHTVLASQENISWRCISGSNYCVYFDAALTQPRETTQSFQFKTIP